MADTSLAYSFADLKARVGHILGHGATEGGWSAGQLAQVVRIVQDGYRQFIYPPILPGQATSHDWSFLHPISTLTTYAPYTTGTIAVTDESTTVTLSDGTWPSWAAGCPLVIGTSTYTVHSRDSDTQVTLTAAFDGTTASGVSYTLEHTAVYDLADDFGSFESRLTYASELNYTSLEVIGEEQIRRWVASTDDPGQPRYAAVRPVKMTAAGRQTFQVVLYPRPDAAYVLSYQYRVQPQKMDATTYTYPYGADRHGLTILESCLAAAEAEMGMQDRTHRERFIERLTASIAEDLRNVPRNLGQMDGGESRVVMQNLPYAYYDADDGYGARLWDSRLP